jgi:hypothetical protein
MSVNSNVTVPRGNVVTAAVWAYIRTPAAAPNWLEQYLN